LRGWLYDHSLLRGKLGETLSLAPVATGYQGATSMRGKRLQRDSHAPPFDSPKATAIARDEYDH
jgi:hypothetical protein